ncbi:hypothetical protein JHK84_026968 [Glycine max]|nr:hypothetical protein JHK84_026968 [Glycine max]
MDAKVGATLGKGLNRGIGTVLGGGLGCIAAVLAQNVGNGGVANLIIIGTFATYCRLFPSVKKRYNYGVMIFILTFNLVVVSGVRIQDQKVWEIARERLLTIVMDFVGPWHGNFGFFYPWEEYLKIGEVLRELAAIILALGGCLQASTTVDKKWLVPKRQRKNTKVPGLKVQL